jgi:hypothetical protein
MDPLVVKGPVIGRDDAGRPGAVAQRRGHDGRFTAKPMGGLAG